MKNFFSWLLKPWASLAERRGQIRHMTEITQKLQHLKKVKADVAAGGETSSSAAGKVLPAGALMSDEIAARHGLQLSADLKMIIDHPEFFPDEKNLFYLGYFFGNPFRMKRFSNSGEGIFKYVLPDSLVARLPVEILPHTAVIVAGCDFVEGESFLFYGFNQAGEPVGVFLHRRRRSLPVRVGRSLEEVLVSMAEMKGGFPPAVELRREWDRVFFFEDDDNEYRTREELFKHRESLKDYIGFFFIKNDIAYVDRLLGEDHWVFFNYRFNDREALNAIHAFLRRHGVSDTVSGDGYMLDEMEGLVPRLNKDRAMEKFYIIAVGGKGGLAYMHLRQAEELLKQGMVDGGEELFQYHLADGAPSDT